ncbi:MAG: chemotaxis protein CheB [Gemmatimonadaceae bacterium]
MTSHEVVCIGTSWGGLQAVRAILQDLPADFSMAVVLVQHRHRESGGLLTELLQEVSLLPVCEVEDKQPIRTGHVHIAPSNYHLLVDDGYFALSIDEPVHYSRPSIDVTFTSIADEFRMRAAGVVLTGANDDGAAGLRRIAERGGYAIVQDPDGAESPTMPRAAIAAVPLAHLLPLDGIGPRLVSLAQAPGTAGRGRTGALTPAAERRPAGQSEARPGGGAP